MAILTGRYGSVKYDPTGVGGATAVAIIGLNAWKLDVKTDYEEVSQFGDQNKVYVPGLKDISGTLGGFWDSTDPTLFEAADATTPGLLELLPNENEVTAKFSGLAYMDASIDCSLAAPKVSSTFKAAGPWTTPTGTLLRVPGGGLPVGAGGVPGTATRGKIAA
jgi:hypothetical protein